MRGNASLRLTACALLMGMAITGCVSRTSDCTVGEQGCACASGDRCFGDLTCGGGICNRPVAPGDDGGMSALDAGPAPSACDACRTDQACVEGACIDPPSMCPCPPETYCDLGAGRCVLGCTSDDGCDPTRARICDASTRSCVDGCRDDPGCPSGQICEGEGCRPGCRDDAACGPGQICEGLACRAGCRGDATCDAGQICEGLACRAGCRDDGGCPGATDVCDLATSSCRAGCRDDGDCPIEQVCDASAAQCEPGCRDGTDCHPGRSCDGGTCACPSGLTPCGTTCVDVSTSSTHCGECDRACSGPATECRAGTCTEVRPTTGQYADCDADADCSSDTNGCLWFEHPDDGSIRGFCSVPCEGGTPSNCDPAPSGTAVPSCFGPGPVWCALDCGAGRTCPTGMECFGGTCF